MAKDPEVCYPGQQAASKWPNCCGLLVLVLRVDHLRICKATRSEVFEHRFFCLDLPIKNRPPQSPS